MCGFAGILNFDGRPVSLPDLRTMAQVLAHRGPDGEGVALLGMSGDTWVDFSGASPPATSDPPTFGLAHRRLAIIDLSPAGLQPRSNSDKKIWIAYNGEIYNYLELRQELESLGHRFASATDTEVLLQAYEEWGLDCLPKLNGMWAFAIWDARRRSIVLCRDRFGIKPLYWMEDAGRFAFASEPKALLKLQAVHKTPNLTAVADYLVHSREDCFSRTFFKGISQIEPGHVLEISFDANETPKPRRWWDISTTLNDVTLSDAQAEEQFKELFESAVRLRLRSDVPVGTCLSGGLDSSAIVVTAMPWLERQNHRSYSAVYGSDFALDETAYIDLVAEHAGIENHKCCPTAETLLEDLDAFIYQQDEPFGSTSQYAQYKVFQLVRAHGTKVTLDGQGADETMAGYHYFFPVHIASQFRNARLYSALSELFHYSYTTGVPFPRALLETAAGFLGHRTIIRLANIYDRGRSTNWVDHDLTDAAKSIEVREYNPFPAGLNRRLYEIFSSSGLPALLRYEDRNSMAFGVEARLPFLDHRLVSFLFSQPALRKIRRGETKYLLRHALNSALPKVIQDRRDKIGFATPESDWFKGPLFEHFHDTFTSQRTRERGLYRTEALLALHQANASGRVDGGRALWRAFNLEKWYRAFID